MSVLNPVVVGEDAKPYLLIFSHGYTEFINFQKPLVIAISKRMWIGKNTGGLLEKLSALFYLITQEVGQHNRDSQYLKALGKTYGDEITRLIYAIEKSCKKDLLDLRNFKELGS